MRKLIACPGGVMDIGAKLNLARDTPAMNSLIVFIRARVQPALGLAPMLTAFCFKTRVAVPTRNVLRTDAMDLLATKYAGTISIITANATKTVTA